MGENQKKICPKCGTELMEDNFCMGCGAYVDPVTKKESSESYGSGSNDASNSFGSFGSSAAAGTGGILGGGVLGENGVLGNGILSDGGIGASGSGNVSGNVSGNASGSGSEGASGSNMDNPFGVDMASILGGIEPDQSFSGAGAASDAEGGSGSAAGNGYGSNGYGNNGYGSNGYGNNGYGYGAGANAGYGASGGGYGPNGAGRSSGYAEGSSDKMPLLQSILIMAGIAIVVFFGIFIADTATKLKDEITTLYIYDSKNDIEESMSILAAGDKVKQIIEEDRWNIANRSSEEIETVKEFMLEYGKEYDAYDFITFDMKEEGSSLVISIIYRDLDKRANVKSLVKLGIVQDGGGDYVSLKETVKSLKSSGWSDQAGASAR